MNNLMPCGLEDDRVRYEVDEDEEENLLTIPEQQIKWLCDDWQDALKDGSYETWHDIRMVLYGASQTLNQIGLNYELRTMISDLERMAFENSIEQIKLGNYEGAPQ